MASPAPFALPGVTVPVLQEPRLRAAGPGTRLAVSPAGEMRW